MVGRMALFVVRMALFGRGFDETTANTRHDCDHTENCLHTTDLASFLDLHQASPSADCDSSRKPVLLNLITDRKVRFRLIFAG
jgi:hypothetical protein